MIANILRVLPALKSAAAACLILMAAGGTSSCDLGSSSTSSSSPQVTPTDDGVVVVDDNGNEAPPVTNSNGGGSGTILAFGDSITAGTYGESWGYKLGRMTGRPVVVSGKGNTVSAEGLARLSSAIDQAKPKTVCILYGTNDCRKGVSASTLAANLARMTAIARSKGASVVVGTVPPQIGSAAKYAGQVNAANSALPGAVQGAGGAVAGVYSALAGRSGVMSKDGFHPEDAGQAVIAAAFADRL